MPIKNEEASKVKNSATKNFNIFLDKRLRLDMKNLISLEFHLLKNYR